MCKSKRKRKQNKTVGKIHRVVHRIVRFVRECQCIVYGANILCLIFWSFSTWYIRSYIWKLRINNTQSKKLTFKNMVQLSREFVLLIYEKPIFDLFYLSLSRYDWLSMIYVKYIHSTYWVGLIWHMSEHFLCAFINSTTRPSILSLQFVFSLSQSMCQNILYLYTLVCVCEPQPHRFGLQNVANRMYFESTAW